MANMKSVLFWKPHVHHLKNYSNMLYFWIYVNENIIAFDIIFECWSLMNNVMRCMQYKDVKIDTNNWNANINNYN